MYTKEQFVGLTVDEVYSVFGGKSNRGVTSKAIRSLLSIGYKRGEVAKMLDIRYQHVRNVQLEPLKKEANSQ